jgi:hypothetical protein
LHKAKRPDIAQPYLHEIVATFLLTGGRQSEVLGLCAEDKSPSPKRDPSFTEDRNFGLRVRDHARSNRSRFITLTQAATKSRTNFSSVSSQA